MYIIYICRHDVSSGSGLTVKSRASGSGGNEWKLDMDQGVRHQLNNWTGQSPVYMPY